MIPLSGLQTTVPPPPTGVSCHCGKGPPLQNSALAPLCLPLFFSKPKRPCHHPLPGPCPAHHGSRSSFAHPLYVDVLLVAFSFLQPFKCLSQHALLHSHQSGQPIFVFFLSSGFILPFVIQVSKEAGYHPHPHVHRRKPSGFPPASSTCGHALLRLLHLPGCPFSSLSAPSSATLLVPLLLVMLLCPRQSDRAEGSLQPPFHPLPRFLWCCLPLSALGSSFSIPYAFPLRTVSHPTPILRY